MLFMQLDKNYVEELRNKDWKIKKRLLKKYV